MNDRSDIRKQVIAAARREALRMIAVRAAESAGVALAGAAVATAAGQVGWLLADAGASLAVAACLLPAVAALLLVRRDVRRAFGLDVRGAALAAGACVASAAASASAVLAGGHSARWDVPAVCLAVAGLIGAGLAVLRGVSLRAAAAGHDAAAGLHERFATAVELARGPSGDEPVALCVCSQALDAVGRRPMPPGGRWRRSRRTAGAVLVGVLATAALALVPTGEQLAVARDFERAASAVERLGPAERAELIATLRRLVEAAEDNPDLRERLRAAIAAAETEDDARLADALRHAGRAADADAAEAAGLARALLRALDLPTGGGEDAGEGPGAAPPTPPVAAADANLPADPDAPTPLAARVLVYDPAYNPRGDANAPAPATAAAGGERFIPHRDAWTAARARAAAALAGRELPPEYRPIVRRFFELDASR